MQEKPAMMKSTQHIDDKAIETFIGIDLGCTYSHVCVLDREGEAIDVGRIRTTPEALRNRFGAMPRARVVIESGPVSRFVDMELRTLGHQVLVANPRKVKAIFGNEKKCDKVDAEMLARLGRVDPKLLSPVRHRSEHAQAGLRLVRARDVAVRMRTAQINVVRGICKAAGTKLIACETSRFAEMAMDSVPGEMLAELEPLLHLIEQTSETIAIYDAQLKARADELAPVARRLTTIPGVGLLTAVAFALTVDDPQRFSSSRDVGAYFGLRPRRDQSGDTDKQLPISKCGDRQVRRLLVQCAQHILRKNSKLDSDLRRWGIRVAGESKNGRKRAVVAVARKLAVLMHRLWVTGTDYVPNHQRKEA